MTEETAQRHIKGGCHCGNVQFTYSLPQPEGAIPVRACSCTFCRKHGGVYSSQPDARIAVRIADATQVQRYHFGTETADFLLCRGCGVVPAVTSEIEGRLYAVVNTNAFEGVDPEDMVAAVANFDGESTDSRLARRQRNWIPDVTIDWDAG